jgi:predicted site-specific integrase-resolvase
MNTEIVTEPMSVSGLAEKIGVSRQRIYVLVKEGRIAAIPMAGGFVIMPDEVNRVLDSVTRVKLKQGQPDRICFDIMPI